MCCKTHVLTQRMTLPLKTHLPWTLCHRNTLYQKETMNHLINTLKKLTLITPWPNYWNTSANVRPNHKLKIYCSKIPHTTTNLSQLTEKLQHLTMALQPVPQSSEEPVHKTMQAYAETLHATQRGSNLTTTMIQDILTLDGQDTSKLGDIGHRNHS